MRFLWSILVAAIALTSAAYASSETGSRVLVAHDPTWTKEEYSSYLAALENSGLQLSYRSIKEPTPALWEYDEAAFDHLLLFAPSAKSLPSDLSPQKLVQFLQRNGNILFVLSSELSESYRDLAREFDLEFEESGSALIDHFHALQNDVQHTSVALPPAATLNKLDGVFGSSHQELPFLYKGALHRLGANPLAFSLLRPTKVSYSFDPPTDSPIAATTIERLDSPDRDAVLGSDNSASLISAFQLLDTERRSPDDGPKRQGSAGRAVWSGSVEAFSDSFINKKHFQTRDGKSYAGTSNLAVLSSITEWLTQQRGVLKVEKTSHHRVKLHDKDVRESYEEMDVVDDDGQERLQRMYRIKDTVTFVMDITAKTPSGWAPAPANLDLQISLVMLDPYITTNLTAGQPQSKTEVLESVSKTSSRVTRYSTTFQLPDRHGVYTFVVDWKRHGWSYIHTRDTSPVRPYNHDEYPRGLHSAWPYVAGATSTMLAFVIFTYFWISTQDDETSQEKQQRKNN